MPVPNTSSIKVMRKSRLFKNQYPIAKAVVGCNKNRVWFRLRIVEITRNRFSKFYPGFIPNPGYMVSPLTLRFRRDRRQVSGFNLLVPPS